MNKRRLVGFCHYCTCAFETQCKYGFYISHFDRNDIPFWLMKYHVNNTQNEMPTHVHQNIESFWNAGKMKLHVNRTCFYAGLKSHTGILPVVWTYSKINEKIESIISCYYGEMPNVKAHQQISKKQCFEKYCLCDKACQFSALQGTHWWNYLENPTIDDKFINKQVRIFIRF